MEFSSDDSPTEDLSLWKSIISASATVTTVLLFLTGTQVCRGIIQKGTTGDLSSLPFVVGALNCAVWFKYGLYISDTPLLIVNGIGCLLQSSYTICYYLYTKDSLRTIRQQIVFALTAFAIIVVVADFYLDNLESRKSVLGLIGSCLAVSFFASPLASLAHAIRTKSTEVLPFYMILASFMVGGLWWIYGIMLNDNFIKIPNFLGLVLASIQLVPFFIFKSKTSPNGNLIEEKEIY